MPWVERLEFCIAKTLRTEPPVNGYIHQSVPVPAKNACLPRLGYLRPFKIHKQRWMPSQEEETTDSGQESRRGCAGGANGCATEETPTQGIF